MTVAADGERSAVVVPRGEDCSDGWEKKCGSSCGSEKTVAASGRRNAPSATRRKWRDTSDDEGPGRAAEALVKKGDALAAAWSESNAKLASMNSSDRQASDQMMVEMRKACPTGR